MRWFSISLLTLALVSSAVSAGAEDPKTKPAYDPKAAHAEADQNGDGQIDRREFHVRVVEVFFHADTDKNGSMKPEELNAATVRDEDFSKADKNGDGMITLYEFIEIRYHAFDEADTDKNGMLSVEEVVEAFEQ